MPIKTSLLIALLVASQLVLFTDSTVSTAKLTIYDEESSDTSGLRSRRENRAERVQAANNNKEDACCKSGQDAANNHGHCSSVNISGSMLANDGNTLNCQLTAKMCCLTVQQFKLCKRVAKDVFSLEPVDQLLGNSMQQKGNYIQVDVNASSLSNLLATQNTCDNKRNTDALCCLGCNLGILSVGQRLAKWKGEIAVESIATLELDKWCDPAEADNLKNVNMAVAESPGFRQCCRESLKAIRRNVRWCDLKPAVCSHRCHEALSESGQVMCSCYEGYRLGADGGTCEDINECDELTHNCDPLFEKCHNTIGGFQCLARGEAVADLFPVGNCSKGSYFNITEDRCKDIDECRFSMHNCNLRTQVCRNFLGSFLCLDIDRQCPSGFRKSDKPSEHGAALNCVDIDECAEKNFDCDKRREDCENFIGSYTCEPKLAKRSEKLIVSTTEKPNTEVSTNSSDPTNCAKGYHFVRFTFQCEDINECRIGQHDCDLTKEKCINFPGSFQCVSLNGDPPSIGGEGHKAGKSASLKMTKECEEGYERNMEYDFCEDIDECSQPISPCPSTSHCQNILGSYVCHCKTGYIKKNDTNQCEDVDECAKNVHSCFGLLKCVNTIGSYECVSLRPAERAQQSTSQKCEPDQIYDYQLGKCILGGTERLREMEESNGGRREVKCNSGERIVNGECRPIECGAGFVYNATQERCQDVNECVKFGPCKASEKCTNTVGSYRCTLRCNAGYRSVAGGLACEDIDECALGSYTCPPNKVCKNRPGSYVCECPRGYVNRKGECEDIDECAVGDAIVCADSRHKCINTAGSFKCECKQGFVEERNFYGRAECVDIDECTNKTLNKCHQMCYNYAGSYKCACKSGYELAADGQTCVDIDECATLQNSSRYRAKKWRRSANETVGHQSESDNVCYFDCVNLPGSFRCECPPGYEPLNDGRICKDIDECEQDETASKLCSGTNEYCLNVRGSYRCNVINCPKGYFLEPNSRKCLRHMDGIQGFFDPKEPLSFSYNYLSIVSNMRIPNPPGYIDLVAMSGPIFAVTGITFNLSVGASRPAAFNIEAAKREHFLIRRPEYNKIIISLVKPLQGPQDVELELVVSLWNNKQLSGSTKAMITIVVSEYDF